MPFNHATVDIRNGLLRTWPSDEVWSKVHPDPDLDMDEVAAKVEPVRKVVRSETWELVARTKPASE